MSEMTLSELRETMTALAGDFSADALTVDAAERVVTDAAAIKHMAATIEALAAAKVAATDRWKTGGDATPEEWLARRTGVSKGQAKAALRTAKTLDGLPEVAGAARAGALSPTQTAEIADAAAADPNAEHRLVALAKANASVGELRDECRRTRAAADPDPDATNGRIHRSRFLRTFNDSEGAFNLHLRNTVAAGSTVMAALQPFIDRAFAHARKAGHREDPAAYAADAFTELCNRTLTGVARHPAGGGSATAADIPAAPEGAGEPGVVPGTDPKPPPYLGLLRLDLAALQRGHAEGDEVVEIAGVGPIPVTTARHLLGDAVLKLVITNGVDVVNVTHLGRGPTVAQKTALLWSSPTCTVHGCNRARRLQKDHRTPWATEQVTELHNLDHLCSHHHALKTNHHWALTTGTGKRPMVPPDHPDHPERPGARRGTRPPPHPPPPPPGASPPAATGPTPQQRPLDLDGTDAA